MPSNGHHLIRLQLVDRQKCFSSMLHFTAPDEQQEVRDQGYSTEGCEEGSGHLNAYRI